MKFIERLRQMVSPHLHRTPPSTITSGNFDPYNLDNPLFYVSPVDAFTIRDACEGVQIFGAIGSGKTSGSGATISKSFLRADFGGLVLCAKPDERQLWQRYARQTGREQSLIIFSPDHGWRFSFLDYELRREGQGGGMTENLVALLTQVVEIAEGKIAQSSRDPFWERAMKELLRNSIDLLSLSQGTITLEDLCRLIADAPQSPDQAQPRTILNPEWEEESSEYKRWEEENRKYLHWWSSSFCAKCLLIASEKTKTTRQAHDLDQASRYFLKTYAGLAERTRSSIVATFTSIADILLHGVAWELLGTQTNIVPEVTWKDGAIIILDLPVQEYHEVGRVVQGIFKLMWQKAVLRRDGKQYPRPVFLWADESQAVALSSFDYEYQSVARSARACTVYLTQNISNYYSVLGSTGRDEANALLGNFQTKIFHANSDTSTNQYAADTIAQRWMTVYSYGSSSSGNGNSTNTGGSESVQYKVLPGEFSVLRKGGPTNNLLVEGIVFQGGRVWQATGDTYIKAVFRQE